MDDKTFIDKFFDFFKNNRFLAPIILVVIILTIIDNTTTTFISLKTKFYTFVDNSKQYSDSKSTSLFLELYTMEDKTQMKKKLQNHLQTYPSFVMPYMLMYDYYITVDEPKAAKLILRKAAKNAKPRKIQDYYELINNLYEHNIEIDLQKKYIKEAYLLKDENYQYQEKIKNLFEKITKQSIQ